MVEIVIYICNLLIWNSMSVKTIQHCSATAPVRPVGIHSALKIEKVSGCRHVRAVMSYFTKCEQCIIDKCLEIEKRIKSFFFEQDIILWVTTLITCNFHVHIWPCLEIEKRMESFFEQEIILRVIIINIDKLELSSAYLALMCNCLFHEMWTMHYQQMFRNWKKNVKLFLGKGRFTE